jgi:hypothetical protein
LVQAESQQGLNPVGGEGRSMIAEQEPELRNNLYRHFAAWQLGEY